MEGDTKKTQDSNTNTMATPTAETSSNPPTPKEQVKSKTKSSGTNNDIRFNSNDIGRTTVARKEHNYFTNIKKTHKSLKQLFSQSPKAFFTKRRIIILSIATLLIVGIIATVIFFLVNSSNNTDPSPENTTEETSATTDSETEKQIEQYAEQLNNDTSSSSDEEVVNTGEIREQLHAISTKNNLDDESRVEATITLSESYYNESQFSEAITVIEETLSDNTYSPALTYSLLSPLYNYYQSLGDNEGQKKTLERMVQNLSQMDPNEYPIALSKDYYQSKLEELNNAH